VDRVPEGLTLAPAEALREAQRLLDEGLPFQAHEVLEGTWKATDGPERALWQGLAQLAVGLTHAQRGNATGAAALLARGAERIEPYAADPPHRVDVAGLVSFAVKLAERISGAGLSSVTDADRRPRLRR
jgi:predicted metal-dependent hydrolase